MYHPPFFILEELSGLLEFFQIRFDLGDLA